MSHCREGASTALVTLDKWTERLSWTERLEMGLGETCPSWQGRCSLLRALFKGLEGKNNMGENLKKKKKVGKDKKGKVGSNKF